MRYVGYYIVIGTHRYLVDRLDSSTLVLATGSARENPTRLDVCVERQMEDMLSVSFSEEIFTAFHDTAR